jgi:FkbM family methyltransferase
VLHVRECVRQRNLQAPDRAMGAGPFRPRLRGATAIIHDPYAMSSIREIWVRDVYLDGGYLTILPGAMVLDLGANRGFFTALALGSHPDVRCICVEPRLSDCDRIRHMLDVNGWQERAEICSAFIGGETQIQRDMIANEQGIQQEYLSEDEFIRRYNLARIGLLKCDIEGSEFDLFKPGSRLLAMADQVAIEVHAAAADENRAKFIELVRSAGFELIVRQENPFDCIINGRRTAPASSPTPAATTTTTQPAAAAAAAGTVS